MTRPRRVLAGLDINTLQEETATQTHTFRLTGYLPGPRHVDEARCGLRVRRASFQTKNDTEFAGLALYLSKRQMRVQKSEFLGLEPAISRQLGGTRCNAPQRNF